MKARIGAVVLCGILCLGRADVAQACAFHGYTPNQTLVDRLLDTEQVVIARLSDANPNKFLPIETLLGPTVTEIDIAPSRLVQSGLRGGSLKGVLLARDGAYGPWREITLLDDRVRALVDEVMKRQSAWQLGGDADRVRLFAGLVNDANPNIRRLALQELDRAPYAVLKVAQIPPVRSLAQDLQDDDASLRPIRILLVGLSKDQGYIPQIASGLDQAVMYDNAHTGAYATALIELSGIDGVALIRDRYLQNANLPALTRDRLLQALAIQYYSVDAPTRRFITQEIATLSRNIPGFQEAAAVQFGF